MREAAVGERSAWVAGAHVREAAGGSGASGGRSQVWGRRRVKGGGCIASVGGYTGCRGPRCGGAAALLDPAADWVAHAERMGARPITCCRCAAVVVAVGAVAVVVDGDDDGYHDNDWRRHHRHRRCHRHRRGRHIRALARSAPAATLFVRMLPETTALASVSLMEFSCFLACDCPPRCLFWEVVVVVVVVVVVAEVVVVVVDIIGVSVRRRTMPSAPMWKPMPDRVLAQPTFSPSSPTGAVSAIPPRTGGHAPPRFCGPTWARTCSARPTHGPLT